jgi:hypothetical protein
MKMKRRMVSFFHFSKYWSTGEMKVTRNPKYVGGGTCPCATLSTTNPTYTDPGIEPGAPRWEAGD